MKGVIGRLALVAAGGGCLALLVFVGLPWLTEAPRPPEEVLAPLMSGDEPEAVAEPEGSRVVGVRTTGEEVAVVFPAAEETAPKGGTSAGSEGPESEEERQVPPDAVEILPPVLSPEEVAAAMDGLDAGMEDEAVLPHGAGGEVSVARGGGSAAEESAAETQMERVERWLAEAMQLGDSRAGRPVEGMPPPFSATRDVQELLEALGYEPGPVDGIWGARTEEAWRRFARNAVDRAAGMVTAEAQGEHEETEPESLVVPSVAESPTPSGPTAVPEGPATGQAGEIRRRAGLPPGVVPELERVSESKGTTEPEGETEPEAVREAERVPQPVTVPGTLRGVMGYRMPLVSRQGVPDQVVAGVLIPAHTTFVIVKPGYWELVGLEPGEVERLRKPVEPVAEPVRRGWNPFRLFRKGSARSGGNGP